MLLGAMVVLAAFVAACATRPAAQSTTAAEPVVAETSKGDSASLNGDLAEQGFPETVDASVTASLEEADLTEASASELTVTRADVSGPRNPQLYRIQNINESFAELWGAADAEVAKTIYVDIKRNGDYRFIFDFDGPLTVPAGEKVKFVVTSTFADTDYWAGVDFVLSVEGPQRMRPKGEILAELKLYAGNQKAVVITVPRDLDILHMYSGAWANRGTAYTIEVVR